jgi:hypothetical protein
MCVPSHESPAGKPAGPGRPAKYTGTAKYVLRNPQYVPVCTLHCTGPAVTKEMQQIKKKSMYWYVLSTYRYIPFYEPPFASGAILKFLPIPSRNACSDAARRAAPRRPAYLYSSSLAWTGLGSRAGASPRPRDGPGSRHMTTLTVPAAAGLRPVEVQGGRPGRRAMALPRALRRLSRRWIRPSRRHVRRRASPGRHAGPAAIGPA